MRRSRAAACAGTRRPRQRRCGDAAAVADDRRLGLADRVRVAERVRHGVGELELRVVLVLDEHQDLRVIVLFEQKGHTKKPSAFENRSRSRSGIVKATEPPKVESYQ